MPFLKSFAVSDGVTASETSPATEDLYATPDELQALFGCAHSEETIRFVQGLINAHCNRTSLWPCEVSETITIPGDRMETRLSVTPVIEIYEAAGRYAQGRRDRRSWNQFQYGYAQILALTAAARPQWSPIDVNTIEVMPETGVVFLPNSFYWVPWGTIRTRYLAGFITMPHRVKCAVAELLNTMGQKGASDRVRYGVGRVNRQFVSDSFLTPQAKQLLAPFVIQTLA